MRLRTALKICRHRFDHPIRHRKWRPLHHRTGTVHEAIRFGQRKWHDERFLCVPTVEEQEQQIELFRWMFGKAEAVQ